MKKTINQLFKNIICGLIDKHHLQLIHILQWRYQTQDHELQLITDKWNFEFRKMYPQTSCVCNEPSYCLEH